MAARFYSQLLHSNADSSHWTEDWTILSNSDGIDFRMTFNGMNTAANSTTQNFMMVGWGMNVYSASANNRRSQLMLHRWEESGVDRDAWTQTSTAGPIGPGFLDGDAAVYNTTEQTNSSGVLTLQRTANNHVNSTAYQAMAFVGSAQIFTNVGTNIPANNVGSYYTCSVGFIPDLVFLNRAYNQTLTDPTAVGGTQQSFRVWDSRSFALSQYGTDQMGHGFSLTTVGPTGGYIVSRSSWYDNGAQDSNFRGNVKLVNSFDNQFYCYIFSHAGTNHTFAPRYTAIKWLDDTVHRIGHTTVGASLATRSVQTNSMYINFIMAFATSNNSYDAPGVADISTQAAMSYSFWTRSGGSSSHNAFGGVPGGGYMAGGRVSSFFAEALNNDTGGVQWQIYSVDAGSGGWSYTVTASSNFPDGIIDFLAIGEPINAPTHLMGPDGQSIFLADNSDYDDNLLLLTAPSAVTTTTLKTGQWAGTWNNISWVESFSNVGTPYFSLRLPMSTQGMNILDPGQIQGFQTHVFSSNLNKESVYGLWGVADGGVNPARRGLVTNTEDLVLVDPANAADYYAGIGSVGLNAIHCVEIDGLSGGYGYMSMAMAGSFSAQPIYGPLIVNSTTQSALHSTSFEPDLLLISLIHPNATVAQSGQVADAGGASIGFYDCRSSYGRFINFATYGDMDGAGTDSYFTVISSEMLYIGGSIDNNMKHGISSVSANGFYISATEVNTVQVTNELAKAAVTALKFDDPTIQFKIVDFTLPQSTGTETISLGFAPKQVIGIGANVRTMNYKPTNAGSKSEGHFYGLWAEDDSHSAMVVWNEDLQTTPDHVYGPVNSLFGRIYSGATQGIIAEISSLTVSNSTNLQYEATINTPTGAGQIGFMLAIGVNENIEPPTTIPTTFRANLQTGSAATNVVDETITYTLDGNTPKLLMHKGAFGTTVVNTDQTGGYRFVYATAAATDGASYDQGGISFMNQDAQPAANRDGFNVGRVSNFCPELIYFAGTTASAIVVESCGPDTVNIRGGGNRTQAWPYAQVAMAGSISAARNLTDILSVTSGATVTASCGFRPDLIIMDTIYTQGPAVGSEGSGDALGWSHAVYDARSSNLYGRAINHFFFNGSPDVPNHQINSVMGFANPPGLSYTMDVKSVGDTGFLVQMTAVDTAYTSQGPRINYLAIKFDDPTIDFNIADHVLANGTQTFSLGFAPKFAELMGSNVRTFGYLAPGSLEGIHESYTHGWWTEATTPFVEYSWAEAGGNTTTDAHVGHRYNKFATYRAGAGTTEIADIASVSVTNSTALSFYSTINTGTATGFLGFLLTIGVNENIGSSTPPPSSSGPAAAGPLFRKFPTTENQEFPTPIFEIRKFPSE